MLFYCPTSASNTTTADLMSFINELKAIKAHYALSNESLIRHVYIYCRDNETTEIFITLLKKNDLINTVFDHLVKNLRKRINFYLFSTLFVFLDGKIQDKYKSQFLEALNDKVILESLSNFQLACPFFLYNSKKNDKDYQIYKLSLYILAIEYNLFCPIESAKQEEHRVFEIAVELVEERSRYKTENDLAEAIKEKFVENNKIKQPTWAITCEKIARLIYSKILQDTSFHHINTLKFYDYFSSENRKEIKEFPQIETIISFYNSIKNFPNISIKDLTRRMIDCCQVGENSRELAKLLVNTNLIDFIFSDYSKNYSQINFTLIFSFIFPYIDEEKQKIYMSIFIKRLYLFQQSLCEASLKDLPNGTQYQLCFPQYFNTYSHLTPLEKVSCYIITIKMNIFTTEETENFEKNPTGYLLRVSMDFINKCKSYATWNNEELKNKLIEIMLKQYIISKNKIISIKYINDISVKIVTEFNRLQESKDTWCNPNSSSSHTRNIGRSMPGEAEWKLKCKNNGEMIADNKFKEFLKLDFNNKSEIAKFYLEILNISVNYDTDPKIFLDKWYKKLNKQQHEEMIYYILININSVKFFDRFLEMLKNYFESQDFKDRKNNNDFKENIIFLNDSNNTPILLNYLLEKEELNLSAQCLFCISDEQIKKDFSNKLILLIDKMKNTIGYEDLPIPKSVKGSVKDINRYLACYKAAIKLFPFDFIGHWHHADASTKFKHDIFQVAINLIVNKQCYYDSLDKLKEALKNEFKRTNNTSSLTNKEQEEIYNEIARSLDSEILALSPTNEESYFNAIYCPLSSNKRNCNSSTEKNNEPFGKKARLI